MLESNYSQSKPRFLEYAYLGEINAVIGKLASMAAPENWNFSAVDPNRSFPILRNYLFHTFHRLMEEDKVVERRQYSCFNTGLLTNNRQEIFMLFKKFPGRTKWNFLSFCRESDENMNSFSPLPERAVYYTERSELIFDSRLPLRINIDHIIEDPENFERFDERIRALQKQQLVNIFYGAVDHLKKRIKQNYKTAIPQYYRNKRMASGQIQHLLPLCFSDAAKADLALAVSKVEEGDEQFYCGKTCLTLDMAINNARLITRPDDDWLR